VAVWVCGRGSDHVVVVMAGPENCCPVHAEFAKRLDDRWDNHQQAHRQREEEMCDKIERIFATIANLDRKLNWILGGAAIGIPALQLILHLMSQRGHP